MRILRIKINLNLNIEDIIRIILVGLVLISSIIYVYFNIIKSKNSFLAYAFNGKITEIIEGGRGFPNFKINNKWYYIGITGSHVTNHIQVGDSLIKEKGSTTIKLYRQNKKGEWNVKIYK